jgi:hypothetical protein
MTTKTAKPRKYLRPTAKYGWLSPKGEFYRCIYGNHDLLADRICSQILGAPSERPEFTLEEAGWVHVSTDNLAVFKKPTTKQTDFVLEYCLAWEVDVPRWVEDPNYHCGV